MFWGQSVSFNWVSWEILRHIDPLIARRDLSETILKFASFSVDYEWDERSLEKFSDSNSDYETPPSSPDHPFEKKCPNATPFRILPTSQVQIVYFSDLKIKIISRCGASKK